MPERPPNCPDGSCGECFKCHVGTVQISPAALPTRRNNIAPKKPQLNSYENAVPTDSRGMPYLGPDLQPISQKAFNASRRRREEAIRHPESVKDLKS